MREIVNKTGQPVRVPLPEGRFLYLGPAKSGQVSDQALRLPSFKRLVEQGTIEVLGEGERLVDGKDDPTSPHASTRGHHQPNVVPRKGNR